MKKAKEDRFLFLSLGIVFSVFAAVLLALTLLFLKDGNYPPMIVTLVFSATSAYGIPFSFFAAADRALIIRFIPIYKRYKERPYTDAISHISDELGLKEAGVEKLLRKAIRKKYL